MRRSLFRTLAWLNRALLPSLWRKDLRTLKSWEKAVVAWRFYVTTRTLEP
ncbi:MAG: SsrA-binding protein [Flavobacteriales bacterium]|nr:SsrA-binding protein [Flavobacteriales bacterium]